MPAGKKGERVPDEELEACKYRERTATVEFPSGSPWQVER